MKTWKLPPPAKIADKLKSALLGEMANAEWELLEEKEWDDLAEAPRENNPANHPAQDEDGTRKASLTTATMTEVVSTDAADDTASTRPLSRTSPTPTTTTTFSSSNNTRPSGTSGWMKLKSKQPGT